MWSYSLSSACTAYGERGKGRASGAAVHALIRTASLGVAQMPHAYRVRLLTLATLATSANRPRRPSMHRRVGRRNELAAIHKRRAAFLQSAPGSRCVPGRLDRLAATCHTVHTCPTTVGVVTPRLGWPRRVVACSAGHGAGYDTGRKCNPAPCLAPTPTSTSARCANVCKRL